MYEYCAFILHCQKSQNNLQILLKRAKQERIILIVFSYVLYHVRAMPYRFFSFALHKSGTRIHTFVFAY